MTDQTAYNPPLTVSQQLTANCQLQTLPVMETFYSLQGEGFHQGKAAYFIRLAGCDVGCFWCDIKESWDASGHPKKTIEEIFDEAKSITDKLLTNSKPSFYKPLIVITGGEPLLYNLKELTDIFQKNDYNTHIETSGSSPLSGSWDWICLSPKKFKKPLPQVLAAADELKIIIYNKSDFKWAEENAAKVSVHCRLYLQPEWSKILEVSPLIIDYIKINPRWQLSLQIHKYINIP